MTTTADLIASARRHLLGRERQALNQLGANIDNATTTVTFTQSLGGIQAGAVIGIGLEEMQVWSVNTAAGSASVLRGHNGSTAASHTAGDTVRVNPKFSDWEFFQALNDDLLDLSSPENGLFQIKTLDLTAVAAQYAYDFPATGFLDVADIRWQVPNTVTHEWREITNYTVNQNLPTTSFASGTAIFFDPHDLPLAYQPVRVRYKATFNPLTSLTDDVATTTGLPASATDIPPLGAAVRLMDGRPVGRADYLSQGDTRRADEVHVADVLNAPSHLEARRRQRINAEYLRLSQVWEQRLRARVRI